MMKHTTCLWDIVVVVGGGGLGVGGRVVVHGGAWRYEAVAGGGAR